MTPSLPSPAEGPGELGYRGVVEVPLSLALGEAGASSLSVVVTGQVCADEGASTPGCALPFELRIVAAVAVDANAAGRPNRYPSLF